MATFRASSAPSPNEELPSDEDVEADAGAVDGESLESELDGEDAFGEDGEAEAEGEEEDEEEDEGDEDEEDASDSADTSDDFASPAISDTLSPAEELRRGSPGLEGVDHERVQDMHGRLLRDNVYGSIEEDVWRRDFTANALYYNIADFSLWDFMGGAEDIAARRLRLIGDPETRYREDPVRMLRAARFEAKLGFELDEATAAPIAQLKGLLTQVPPARLFDETQKLFLTGHAEQSLEVLRRRDLFGVLFPAVESYLTAHPGSLVEQLLRHGLRNTDERVAADRPVTASFLFALLLYGPIAASIEALPPQRWHEIGAIAAACERAVRDASVRVTIPRRIALGVREMYALQPRLEQPRGRRALRLLEQPRFRAGFDLLALRAQLGWRRLPSRSGGRSCRALSRTKGGKDRCVHRGLAAGSARRGRGGFHRAPTSPAPPSPATPLTVHACSGRAPMWASAAIWTSRRCRCGVRCRRSSSCPRRAWCVNRRCTARARGARSISPISSMPSPDCSPNYRCAPSSMRCATCRGDWVERPSAIRWGPRRIDLDLLVFDQMRLQTPELTLPHPGVVTRSFVLYPLYEVAPELRVPGGVRISELLERVDSSDLWRLDHKPITHGA